MIVDPTGPLELDASLAVLIDNGAVEDLAAVDPVTDPRAYDRLQQLVVVELIEFRHDHPDETRARVEIAHHDAGQQVVTLATVAPPIAEALIATAMGLFAAIPAVIAYNRFADRVVRLEYRYDGFMEEFSSILHRHASAKLGG